MRLKYKSFLFLHLCFFYVVLLYLFVFLRFKSSKSKRRNKTNYYPSNIGNKKNMIFIMLHSSCYVCKRTSYFKEQKTHILWNATSPCLKFLTIPPAHSTHTHTHTLWLQKLQEAGLYIMICVYIECVRNQISECEHTKFKTHI